MSYREVEYEGTFANQLMLVDNRPRGSQHKQPSLAGTSMQHESRYLFQPPDSKQEVGRKMPT